MGVTGFDREIRI